MHAVAPVLLLVTLGGCAPEAVERPRPVFCDDWEQPYDGLDGDCIVGNEFDFDGDGFVTDRLWTWDGWVDALPMARAYALSQGLNPLDVKGGDCDDFDAAVFPGAPGEQPYDAIDTNCDGANDFDVDGDGWIPVGYWNDVAWFVAQYQDGFATFEVREGDCDDADPFVNPDMEDVPYDGHDTNCDRRNDFDIDGDHYIAAGYADAWRAWSEAYGMEHPVEGFGDCDDDNDFVNPGAPERVLSPRDIDCDGDPRSGRLAVFDFDITGMGAAAFLQGPTNQALLFSADAVGAPAESGLFGLVLPLTPDLDDPQSVVRLLPDRASLVGMRPLWNGLAVTVVEPERWGTFELGTGGFGPVVDELEYTDEVVTGESLVALVDGDVVCGGGPTRWLQAGETTPSVEQCGAVESVPVLCGPECVAHTGRGEDPLPWSSPTRISGGTALIEGRVFAPDGSQPFAITGADDAAVSGGAAAWIQDGQVYVQGAFGAVGPLLPVRSDSAMLSDGPVPVGFYADEVHLGAYYGYLTVLAIEHGPSGDRIAMARFDP
ncbi:MAG: putative metal-binding motif-containing protein [Myxococcota bacterium]